MTVRAFLIFLFVSTSAAQAPRATGYKPPTPEKRAAYQAISRAKNGGRIAMFVRNQAPPAAFDCREKGWAMPVGDQGSCGSCYLYSTVQTATNAFIKAGYGKPDGSFALAVQYGMDCHDFGGCNGGWGAEVIEWMCKNGWYAETYTDASGKAVKDYPAYEAKARACRVPQGAKKWVPADWGFVNDNGAPSVAEIKAAMINFGVLNVAIDAGGQFGDGAGTITALGSQINHEIQMLAWDDAKDGGAFLLRNQWSTGWGNNGDRWVTYNAAKKLTDIFWVSAAQLPPPPPDPPVPGGITITLSGDLKAGTYQIGGTGPMLDPKMTLEELAALIGKMKKPEPAETKEPPVEKPVPPIEKPIEKPVPPPEKPVEKPKPKVGEEVDGVRIMRWSPGVPFPVGMERYERDGFTQMLHVSADGEPLASKIPVERLPEKFRVSGGMEGIAGWRSDKYRLFPRPPLDQIAVLDGARLPGLTRAYANGTRFDDVLSNDDGKVFEHRSRTLAGEKWVNAILFRDPEARPEGYNELGLKACAKCHKDAGGGEAGKPLAPGGREVFSDALAWNLLRR